MNKKIKNATICTAQNITFKSVLEKTCFTYLEEQGFNPKYEPKKFTIFPSFVPITPFYDRETTAQQKKRIKSIGKYSSRELKLCNRLIQPITYTPDIYIRYNNLDIWIECKGFSNDVFPYKKKMFRKLLDDIYNKTGQKSIYFEIYTKKNLLQAIDIIKNYEQ
jgi:hypothetical protein